MNQSNEVTAGVILAMSVATTTLPDPIEPIRPRYDPSRIDDQAVPATPSSTGLVSYFVQNSRTTLNDRLATPLLHAKAERVSIANASTGLCDRQSCDASALAVRDSWEQAESIIRRAIIEELDYEYESEVELNVKQFVNKRGTVGIEQLIQLCTTEDVSAFVLREVLGAVQQCVSHANRDQIATAIRKLLMTASRPSSRYEAAVALVVLAGSLAKPDIAAAIDRESGIETRSRLVKMHDRL